MKALPKKIVALLGVAGSAVSAFAATTGAAATTSGVDLSQVHLNTSTVLTLAGTILGGLGVIWGIRKVIKLINRS